MSVTEKNETTLTICQIFYDNGEKDRKSATVLRSSRFCRTRTSFKQSTIARVWIL